MTAQLKNMPTVCVFLLATVGFSLSASASTRPIFVGEKNAIILMQGMSALGGTDPQVRELYDAIAMPPVKDPNGEGKVVAVQDRDFSLACGHKGQAWENVTCNISVKASSRSKIDARTKTAEFMVEGAEALQIYEKLAGASGQPFVHDTRDKWIHLESTPNHFYFRFKQAP